jgi:hypothetical protein
LKDKPKARKGVLRFFLYVFELHSLSEGGCCKCCKKATGVDYPTPAILRLRGGGMSAKNPAKPSKLAALAKARKQSSQAQVSENTVKQSTEIIPEIPQQPSTTFANNKQDDRGSFDEKSTPLSCEWYNKDLLASPSSFSKLVTDIDFPTAQDSLANKFFAVIPGHETDTRVAFVKPSPDDVVQNARAGGNSTSDS